MFDNPIDLSIAFEDILESIIIVKNYLGAAYLPEYNFNGIGNLNFSNGYQIKLTNSIEDFQFCSIISSDYDSSDETQNCSIVDYELELPLGWSLLGYYCEESQELLDPVQMYISTWGGSAADMFSVYDLIRSMRGKVPVHTIGLGKVMSAGVVLLASGEKGHRKIGANCRVMFHGVQAGHAGTIFNLENEMEEAKWTQERYIKALVKETNMSLGYLKKLIDRKLNVYFSAEEAVELGIADEII